MEDPRGDEFPAGIGMRKKLSAITLACREIEKLLPREDGDLTMNSIDIQIGPRPVLESVLASFGSIQ